MMATFQNFPTRNFLDQEASLLNDLVKGDIVILGAGYGSPYSDRNEVSYEVATASENAPDARP
tara:strand:- start:927 stop:1115 length:189 start_codon:yes stop_codon:yes gene_type:complete